MSSIDSILGRTRLATAATHSSHPTNNTSLRSGGPHLQGQYPLDVLPEDTSAISSTRSKRPPSLPNAQTERVVPLHPRSRSLAIPSRRDPESGSERDHDCTFLLPTKLDSSRETSSNFGSTRGTRMMAYNAGRLPKLFMDHGNRVWR